MEVDAPGDSGCAPGQTACGGVCVDLDSNHGHCGTCGNACEPIEVCNEGDCSLECSVERIECDGACVDVTSDLFNCGDCGITCVAGVHATPACRSRVCSVTCDSGWSDLDGDGSCESDCVPTSPTEICNGLDDDCDGLPDEGFECRVGFEVACTTSCGSQGAGICTATCQSPPPAACGAPPEVCDGADDDCDGTCDDGWECCRSTSSSCTTSCGTAGTRTCSYDCTWRVCLSGGEICNGQDDDCNGTIDDGATCAAGLYCLEGACWDHPVFTQEPACSDMGVPHTYPDFLGWYTVRGRPGAQVHKWNLHVSCSGAVPGLAPETENPADPMTIQPDGTVTFVIETSGPVLDCQHPNLGQYESWVTVDGFESNHQWSTYYNSLPDCSAEVQTCDAAAGYCPPGG